MKKYIDKIQEIIRLRQKAAFCLITKTQGSTPRKIGSKMIVYSDETVFGSVGGGEIEHFVVQKSQEIIKTQQAQSFSFALKTDFEMACGGNVDVYIEPINIAKQLVIFGGGHISKALVKIAKDFDFSIIVIDERENIFDAWEKSENIILLNEHYDIAIPKITFDYNTLVCIITHAHTHDKALAGICGKKEAAYLGVIASKTKSAKFSKELLEEGTLTQEQIDKIDMPMGFAMNCETPEEIAISILAKLIDTKNKI
jgi:xanthine dehydrogenase accessory factor